MVSAPFRRDPEVCTVCLRPHHTTQESVSSNPMVQREVTVLDVKAVTCTIPVQQSTGTDCIRLRSAGADTAECA